ncbi:uncharacterized protein [Pleurodeles waltl]|uniref:uncharacterized protein n=1 Tax=Pleurodeles waltl TaxID=8319 RepID=UPI003709BFE5
MGRPRKDGTTGGDSVCVGGASAPPSKPSTSRSALSSTRAKTTPTARSAPSTRAQNVSDKDTGRSASGQGSRKTTPHSYAATTSFLQGDMNNNQEAGFRSSANEGGKSRARVANASNSTPTRNAASSGQSERGIHSTRTTPVKMPSKEGGQGEPLYTWHKSLEKEIHDIEIETRGQRDNPKWHEWRENRITASVAHKIANSKFVNGKSSEVPQSYLKAVVNQSPNIQTPAMSWGIRNEKRAVQEYEHLKSRNHSRGVKVEDCGLFIHPEKNWLAASPDGIVKDNSTGKPVGLLEVKCPYKHKDNTIRDACKDGNFCLTQDGDSYALKKDHPYYTQVQTQMATTGLKKTDFVVYTKKETAIAPVEFDAKFWEATEPKLEKFYTDAVVPHMEKRNALAWATEE